MENEVANILTFPVPPNRDKFRHPLWNLEVGISLELGAWRLELSHPLPKHAHPTRNTAFYYPKNSLPLNHKPPLDSVTYRRIDTLLLFPKKTPSDTHFDPYPCAFHHLFKNTLFIANAKTIFRITFLSVFLPDGGQRHIGRARLPASPPRR